ncbi:MAG: hypothetical protein OEZ22_10595 [Spirochaetia bacterium]|nr:hypothetical protein [Spirochaetia bacterium]
MKKKFFILIIISTSILYSQNNKEKKTENSEDVEKKQQEIFVQTADNLYNDEKIKIAYLYYKDFLEIYPQSQYKKYIKEKIAEIYEKTHEYHKAAEIFSQLQHEEENLNEKIRYLYHEARLYDMTGFYSLSVDKYKKIIKLDDTGTFSNIAREKLKYIADNNLLH